MTTFTVEIWNSTKTVERTGSPHVETMDSPDDEYGIKNLTHKFIVNYGYSDCSFEVWKPFADYVIEYGDVVIIKEDSTTVYRGYVTSITPDITHQNPYSERISVQCNNTIWKSNGLTYTLEESDGGGGYKAISTTNQKIMNDVFLGNEFSGKHQTPQLPICDNTPITYSAANNNIPDVTLEYQYTAAEPMDVVREAIDIGNGTKDLTTTEPHIAWLDSNNAFHCAERSTSVLATFDLGKPGDFQLLGSEDVEPDGYIVTPYSLDDIKNTVYLGDTLISTAHYSSQRATSISKYGIRVLPIPKDNVKLSDITELVDSYILWYLDNKLTLNGAERNIEVYTVKLKMIKYGYSPLQFSTPNGYIAVTENGGTPKVLAPFISMTKSYSSFGVQHVIQFGYQRPNLSYKHLLKKAKEPVALTEDTTPPTITYIDSEPTAKKKTYQKVKNPIYLGAYAKDDTSVSSVSFWRSKWSGSAWSAYTLIGSGTWNNPPDSDSEGYYEYSLNDGYYDLIATAGYARGDIFRIKSVAKDPAGNAGEDVQEFQLDDNPPMVQVTAVLPDSLNEQKTAPSVIEVASADGVRLKAVVEDQSIDTVTCTYGGNAVTVTKVDDGNEHYYITDNLTKPPVGSRYTAVLTFTNVFGVQTKSLHYIKGLAPAAPALQGAVRDYDTTIDDTKATIPEYTDKIEFSIAYHKKDFYKVSIDDVSFKIYKQSDDSLVKTLTSVSTPGITSDGGGVYKCATNVTALGLTGDYYYFVPTLIEKEDFKDEAGTVHTESYSQDGNKTQFRLINKTLRGRLNDTDGILAVYTPIVDDHDVTITDHTSDIADIKPRVKKTFTHGSDQWTTETVYEDGDPPRLKVIVKDQNGDVVTAMTKYITLEGDVPGGSGGTYLINTYAGIDYKLYVSSTDGSITYTKDPTGTPLVLFKITNAGAITTSGDIGPDTDATNDLGSATMQYANAYFSDKIECNEVKVSGTTSNISPLVDEGADLGTSTEKFVDTYTKNLVLGDGTAKLTWNGTAGKMIPEYVAFGFWED